MLRVGVLVKAAGPRGLVLAGPGVGARAAVARYVGVRGMAAGTAGGRKDDDEHDGDDDDKKRGRGGRRSRWIGTVSQYAQRGAVAVYGGVRQVLAVKTNVERGLLRSGIVKDADAAAFLGTTASITFWAALGLTAAGTFGIDTKPLLAGVGITGFTVGFALKDIASNYLSGVFLLMNRPFRPGMVVTVGDPGKKVRGVYMKMDLRYLYLKTDRDGPETDTILLVPNSIVFASDISVSQPQPPPSASKDDSTLEKITH